MIRIRFLVALASVLVAATTFRATVAMRPEPYELYSTMAWDACRFGPASCSPVFHPVADGEFRGLTCGNGWCAPMVYTYWTDENCNRLTACAAYKPHRGDLK